MTKITKVLLLLFCFNLTFIGSSLAAEKQKLRIGSLQYGSVNWELKLIKELKKIN